MAIVDDYTEIGRRYHALTDRWIPKRSEPDLGKYPIMYWHLENFMPPTAESCAEVQADTPVFDKKIGEVMKGSVSVSAEVRNIVERIKARGK